MFENKLTILKNIGLEQIHHNLGPRGVKKNLNARDASASGSSNNSQPLLRPLKSDHLGQVVVF